MPRSALPDHLNDPEEIESAFPDDKQYGTGLFGRFYTWIHKKSKTWFVFSYRCTEWWARWRRYPKVLFAIRSKQGTFRLEAERGLEGQYDETTIFNDDHFYVEYNLGHGIACMERAYLSRIQYYTRWHIAVQWPLMISFHWYPKSSDVPIIGKPRGSLKGKVWYGYWNHFDADLVYWMFFSFFFGRTWK